MNQCGCNTLAKVGASCVPTRLGNRMAQGHKKKLWAWVAPCSIGKRKQALQCVVVGIRLQSCKHLQAFSVFWCVLCGWSGWDTRGTGKTKRNSISTTPGSYHSLNIGKCPNIFRTLQICSFLPFPELPGVVLSSQSSFVPKCKLMLLDCVKVPDLSF